MKKLLSGLFAFAMIFGLAGCNKDDEKEKELPPFAKYLEESSGLTVSKLNDLVGPLSVPNIEGYLTDLDVQNTKMTVDMESEDEQIDGTAYLWSETETVGNKQNKFVYAAIPVDPQGEVYEKNQVNLTEIDEYLKDTMDSIVEDEIYVSEILVDIDNSGSVEFSEFIDKMIELYGLDTDELNTADILSKINFSIDDFEDKGNGVYKLKSDSLVNVVEEILGDYSLSADMEDIELLADSLDIKVKFANDHIEQVTVEFNLEDDGKCYTGKMTFKFTYNEGEVVKTEIKTAVQIEGNHSNSVGEYYSMTYVVGENEFSFSTKIGETALNIYQTVSFSLVELNGKTTIELAVDDKEEDFESSLQLEIIGNWLSSLEVSSPGMTCAVESNVNVVIPAEIKASEAKDTTEMLKNIIDEYLAIINEELPIN